MSEANKALSRRYLEEVWNQGHMGAVDELVDPNFVRYEPSAPEALRGREALKQFVTAIRAGLPDVYHWIEGDLVAEGDKVVMRWSGRGTHTRELFGIPPTNKSVTVTGLTMLRVSGGKIAEDWTHWTTLNLLQQLGAVPTR